MTGLATAYMDSIPVVAITANVGVSLLGKDSFQEIDIKGVTMPITKHNYIVKDIEKLADTIRDAFRIAQSGRKGPVLIDVTKDVTAAKTYFESVETGNRSSPVCEYDTGEKHEGGLGDYPQRKASVHFAGRRMCALRCQRTGARICEKGGCAGL